jgi:hypothetical protein
LACTSYTLTAEGYALTVDQYAHLERIGLAKRDIVDGNYYAVIEGKIYKVTIIHKEVK